MSKHHLRKDPLCANCGHLVEERFCPNCGQENTETRQSFGHLVRHFIEDLTHYDSGFWRTMKDLLFKPAYLTKQFLAGKRNSYVHPIRLYFFVSFVAFFIPHFLPAAKNNPGGHALKETGHQLRKWGDRIDSLQTYNVNDNFSVTQSASDQFKSIAQIDSYQHAAPEKDKLGSISYRFQRQYLLFHERKNDGIGEQLVESFAHNFPKALFIYMPLFAFVIWLFHGKRRWLYFDHTIFTVHYLSFIMVLISLVHIIMAPFNVLPYNRVVDLIRLVLVGCSFLWTCYYFFRAHHKMYEEHAAVSMLKAWPIFIVNILLFLAIIACLFIFSFLTAH